MKCPNCGYVGRITTKLISVDLAVCQNCGVVYDDEIAEKYLNKNSNDWDDPNIGMTIIQMP